MNTVIKFENVKKSFGSKIVLDGISFEVEAGEIVFILGTSGTGKSVLLKNIVGLLKPEQGSIIVNAVDVTKLSEEDFGSVRRFCGMVFQHPALFDSLTVFENVAFGLRRHYRLTEQEIAQKVEKALDLVQLWGIGDKFPNQISFGMQKRVSLARTVAIEPRVLLFDEPTTGLDPITTTAINQLIRELSRKLKTTSVVVSHDMKCALEIADRVIVLDKGSIVAASSPEELLKNRYPLVMDFLMEVRGEFQ